MPASPPTAGDARKRLGVRGENWVSDALQALGFRILRANYRDRGGEIDLIARRGDDIWVVEVKTRRSGSFGPVEVSPHQQRRLTRLAYRFLQQHGQPFDTIQFVVAIVSFEDGQPRIEWIEQAFDSVF